ncbi:MAG: VCBS repeat-containing protein [Pseudomonadota bacterium]
MKTGRIQNTLRIGAWIAMMLLMVSGNPASGGDSEKVAIIPFSMNSQQDLSFLQNGILDMLSSRITQADRVEVLNPDMVSSVLNKAKKSFSAAGALDETKARIIGANLKADYVLFGSFTLLGDNSSLDASMVNVTGVKPTVTFSRQGTGLGSVIPQVNEFATEINARVFGRNQYTAPATTAAQEPSRSPMQEVGGERSERVPGSAFISLKKEQGTKSFTRLADVNGTLNCLAAGDVDNDGIVEVVGATDTDILIFKWSDGRLTMTKNLSMGSAKRIVGIDVGDINGNGVPEIFVSALSILRTVVESSVFEFSGSSYSEVVRNGSYYFRIITGPNGAMRLLGQEQGLSPYAGDIFEMAWKNNNYVPGQALPMPRGASIMGMAAGDLLGNGQSDYVFLNESGSLVMSGTSGKTQWKSSDRFGGGQLYFHQPSKDSDASGGLRTYFQSRLLVQNVTGDNQPEVISINNHEIAGGLLLQFRHYEKGNMEILSWDGLGLSPVLRTAQVTGQIGDFAVADINNDGKKELIVSVITKGKGLTWTTPESSIIRYALE